MRYVTLSVRLTLYVYMFSDEQNLAETDTRNSSIVSEVDPVIYKTQLVNDHKHNQTAILSNPFNRFHLCLE